MFDLRQGTAITEGEEICQATSVGPTWSAYPIAKGFALTTISFDLGR